METHPRYGLDLSPPSIMLGQMKTFRLCFFLGVVLVIGGGCATSTPAGPAAVAGTWTNSLHTVLTLKADGTFDGLATYTKTRKIHVWGTYTIAGDTITFQGAGGNGPKDCQGPGVYHFKRSAEDLQFALVKDDCQSRTRNLTLGLHRK